MRDIELTSAVLTLDNMPENTKKIMLMYDSRGWAIRCYDKEGAKITTLTFSDKQGLGSTVGTLSPEDDSDNELQAWKKLWYEKYPDKPFNARAAKEFIAADPYRNN